jgi:hypothetical protein
VRELTSPGRALRVLSRRALEELGALQASVQVLGAHRNTALRLFVTSRFATTSIAQREFWLEFSWADREYRAAVRRLARFCLRHQHGSPVPRIFDPEEASASFMAAGMHGSSGTGD